MSSNFRKARGSPLLKLRGGGRARGILWRAAGVTALVVVLLFASACGILKSTASADSYALGKDTVPSMKAVVGLRTVSGVDSSTSTDGVLTKTITYSDTQSIQQDLTTYAAYLQNNEGFIVTGSYNFNQPSGTAQLAKQSVDSGQVIILDITYDQSGYVLTFTKGPGTITPNG